MYAPRVRDQKDSDKGSCTKQPHGVSQIVQVSILSKFVNAGEFVFNIQVCYFQEEG